MSLYWAYVKEHKAYHIMYTKKSFHILINRYMYVFNMLR